ncbi:hypothetical protein JHL18_14430 [Clostridium sp. YIM B02505]|uniref:DUF3784 domain-containing protein n=1 Tax=Clostridium yunnanense TaxID=2800325 RepID=A0ABS1ER56_9CLOT|nr:hypothetical protein [Clostridium yunnanense]MBK1811814.1 hypothetical protein [Clostridium yunnanense]
MKNFYGVLEILGLLHVMLFIDLVLGVIINLKITAIIIAIIYIGIGVIIFKKDNTYDKIITTIYKNDILCIDGKLSGNEKDEIEDFIKRLYTSFIVLFLLSILRRDSIIGYVGLNEIILLIVGFFNSCIGLLLYKKYTKPSQYKISVIISVIIVLTYIIYFYK